jgi:HNH endonuclease
MSPLILPIEFLHERLSYNLSTGELCWRSAPALGKNWNTRYAGKVAGRLNNRGYVDIGLTYRDKQHRYTAHCIAFAMTYGRWPVDEIDHKNRVRSDNRLANLREATHVQNNENRTLPVGAGAYCCGRRWKALIRVNGKQKRLGCFASKEDAARAYLAAKAQLHPFATAGG